MAPVVDFKVEWEPVSMAKWERFIRSLDPRQTEDLALEMDKVHRKTVVQGLRSLVLLTPVDTGRLRAAWTPFLRQEGVGFMDVLKDRRALPRVATKRPRRGVDLKAISAGIKEGRVRDEPLDTVIVNNVAYAPHVEARFHMVERVLTWLGRRMRKNYEAWWASIVARANAGAPGFVDVDIAGGRTIV